MTNCGGLFLWARAAHPERPAVLQDGQQLIYAQLDTRANRVAHALADLDITAGDGVAILIRNDLRYVEAVFGALRLGAVVTPVTTRATYPDPPPHPRRQRGRIVPPIHAVYPLKDAREAFRVLLDREVVGKAIVTP